MCKVKKNKKKMKLENFLIELKSAAVTFTLHQTLIISSVTKTPDVDTCYVKKREGKMDTVL